MLSYIYHKDMTHGELLQSGVLVLLAYYVVPNVVSFLIYLSKVPKSRAMAKKMRAERDAGHFEFKALDEKICELLLNSDCTTIREHLFKGTFTSVDLVHYFGDRCQRIGRQIECSTEELFESAMDLARKCDAERRDAIAKGTQNDLPFFHGIPISVKELFHMKGMLTTNGCTFLSERSTFNANPIQPFFDGGVIPIVRGNVPQAGLSIHSVNHIWGEA